MLTTPFLWISQMRVSGFPLECPHVSHMMPPREYAQLPRMKGRSVVTRTSPVAALYSLALARFLPPDAREAVSLCNKPDAQRGRLPINNLMTYIARIGTHDTALPTRFDHASAL